MDYLPLCAKQLICEYVKTLAQIADITTPLCDSYSFTLMQYIKCSCTEL